MAIMAENETNIPLLSIMGMLILTELELSIEKQQLEQHLYTA
jgi:hypothetical protein